jgi:hypothetical protein
MTLTALPVGPQPTGRAAAIRRAALFVLICAPIWLVPTAIGAWHPAAAGDHASRSGNGDKDGDDGTEACPKFGANA